MLKKVIGDAKPGEDVDSDSEDAVIEKETYFGTPIPLLTVNIVVILAFL